MSPSPLSITSSQSRPKAAAASPLTASLKRKTMSITQTYYLAHKARAKLSSEAAQPDHNLRLLVGHANLLDSLMLELADAEREQESWFNRSVRASTKAEDKKKHIQWADALVEEPEEDWDAEDDSSVSDDGEFDESEDIEMADAVELRRMPARTALAAAPKQYVDVEQEDDADDDEDYAQLALQRSPSHSVSPPELIDHDDDSSEDESMPPSPPTTEMPTFSHKEIESSDWQDKDAFYQDGYYLPPRSPAGLVSAISVY